MNRTVSLVTRTILNRVRTDEEFHGMFFDRLRKVFEQTLLREAGSQIIGSPQNDALNFVLNLYRYGITVDSGKEYWTEREISLLVGRLENDFDSDTLRPDAHGKLVRSVIDGYRHAREITDELKLIPERLVGDKPATYERWDRLSAESEFRQAVVPPILAIVAALFSRGVLSWPLGGLFIIPAFVILIQGISKENEANGQLVQALEANVITSPAIDRLMTNDLYWYWRAPTEIRVKAPGQASSEDKTAVLMQEEPVDNAAVGHLSTTQPGSPPKRED